MDNLRIASKRFTKLATLLILVITSILLVSCQLSNLPSTDSIVVTQLVFPEAQYYNAIIRTKNNLIVLVDGGQFGNLQLYAKEGDQSFTQFNFSVDFSCESPRYGAYELLPNENLQVWTGCFTSEGKTTYLMAYDWQTGQLTTITDLLPLGTSGASWNPEQTKAIAYLDGGFATRTLFWIFDGSYAPLDLVITDKNHSWNLSDDFPDFKANDTGKTGTTGRTTWSPDGKAIAFFASPNAIGKTSFDRFGVEFYLYLMDPETLQYEVVADRIFSPFLLSWSPDSNYVAFIGHYGFWKTKGIWLYSTKDNSITEIAEGSFQGIIWRSAQNVVAIKCESIDICNQVIEYDLTEIIN